VKKSRSALLVLTGLFVCVLLCIFILQSNAGRFTVYPNDILSTDEMPADIGKININTATATQLQRLDGIGATLAQRIVDYRTLHGFFRTIEDLTLVDGIGPSKLELIANEITVGGKYEDSGN